MARLIEGFYNPELQRSLDEFILDQGKILRGTSAADVDLTTPLLKYGKGGRSAIELYIPIMSSPMQAVTGSEMAIALASLGGVGVIYASQPYKKEAEMVKKVKAYRGGFVIPEVLRPNDRIEDVQHLIDTRGYSTFPVTENGKPDGRLVGLLTKNDFSYSRHRGMDVKDRMTPTANLELIHLGDILDSENGEPDLEKAYDIVLEGSYGCLPIVDDREGLKYVVFRKDVEEEISNRNQLLDDEKRLVVGAAVNTHDYEKRARRLVDAGADFLVIDTSQGYSEYVEDTLKYLKRKWPDMPVIAGNVISGEGFEYLAEHGADAVKVGMGSGSICITKDQIRVGGGQANTIVHTSAARDKWHDEQDEYIPIISDGGAGNSGAITTALALNADIVMMGGFLAGTEESAAPFETSEKKGKEYWGEGSKRAMEWRKQRYGHTRFEEGFERVVPYVGQLKPYLEESLWKIRDGMRKAGSTGIKHFHENAKLKVVGEVEQEAAETRKSRISRL